MSLRTYVAIRTRMYPRKSDLFVHFRREYTTYMTHGMRQVRAQLQIVHTCNAHLCEFKMHVYVRSTYADAAVQQITALQSHLRMPSALLPTSGGNRSYIAIYTYKYISAVHAHRSRGL